MSKIIKFIFSLLISILGLYYAFNKVNLNELWFYLKSANIFYIILASVLLIFSVAIRAERWQLLLEPIKVISFRPLFSSTMIGYFGNAVMPFRFGELLRAFSIGSIKNIDISAAFGTTIFFITTMRLGSKKSTSFMYLVPTSAIGLSVILLNENLAWSTILGGALAVSAVYLINR